MNILVIVNPTSGKGSSINTCKEVTKYLDELNITYDRYESKSKKDLIKYVVENSSNYTNIFSVGGDGTIRDIIEGLNAVGKPIPLGIIPAGSGNDLTKTLELNKPVRELVDLYLKNNVDKIYSCNINKEMFVNIAGVGIDVDILLRRLKLKRFLSGKLCYAVAALISLFLYTPKDYKVELDDITLEDKYYIITIANGKYLGGGMKISPNANIKSKKLNVIMLGEVSKWKLIKAFSKIYSGDHIDLPYIKEYNVDKISVNFKNRKEYIDYDGDLFESDRLCAQKTSQESVYILK